MYKLLGKTASTRWLLSPAVAAHNLFIRTASKLYRVSKTRVNA
jgi:hypothetical protein